MVVETTAKATLSSEKLASKGTWRLKKRDSEPLGQHMKNPRGCPVYLLFDQLNERGIQLISVSHAGHVFIS